MVAQGRFAATAIHTAPGFVDTSATAGPPGGNLRVDLHQTRGCPGAILAYCNPPEFRLPQRDLKDSLMCADDQS